LFSIFPYTVLMLLIYFVTTENCGSKCSEYFKQLPKEGPVEIYAKEATGHLFITQNGDARQITIYTLSKVVNELTVSSDGQLKTTKTYNNVWTKAKRVNFSDFKKTDPVLSNFKDME